ncbi:MAG TPA: DUF1918 domain-containing protein [Terriglobia bacterium]|jgi:hypothetical protein
MLRNPQEQRPKFKAGDRVVVVGPGVHRERRGIVAEVRHSGDYVYRYRVRFADGASEQFFGFELAPVEGD